MGKPLKEEKELLDSDIGNTYGTLSMVEIGGNSYLKMYDHLEHRYYGPLTPEQIEAFKTLREVEEAADLKNPPYTDTQWKARNP